ncbi:oligosaccharide flippase family protein [Glaciimonas sp. Cout2]|uniref:lipopolysaccharide biosynthesis protein n=2 Tax=unclassified Glaciimonas TaxID=2644401 RepID=UPI002B22DF20|nr:oligosaccharide flippase family protein [Glaciimonas sp. Cout2]MEB0014183.1 oligosaccharide flippase family protein [Glaciimonas sp. Cout2]
MLVKDVKSFFKLARILEYKQDFRQHSQIYKNVGWLIGEKLLTIALVLFCDGLLARTITIGEFGQWQYSLNLASMIGCVGFVAGAEVIIPALARYTRLRSEIITAGFIVRSFFSLLTVLLSAIICDVFFDNSVVGKLVVIALIIVVVNETTSVIVAYFQAITNIRPVVLCRLLALAIRASLFYVVSLNTKNIFLFISVRGIEVVVTGILLVLLIRTQPIYWRPNTRIIKIILIRGIRFLPSILAMYAYTKIDRIFVQKYFSYEYLAVYSIAQQYVEQCFLLITIVVQSISPKYIFSTQYTSLNFRQVIFKIGFFLFLIATFLIIVTQLIGNIFISSVFGSKYLGSFEIMRVLVVTTIPFAIDTLATQILLKEKAAFLLFLKWLVMAVFAVFMYVIVLPIMGSSNIRYIFIINFTVMALLSLILVKCYCFKTH